MRDNYQKFLRFSEIHVCSNLILFAYTRNKKNTMLCKRLLFIGAHGTLWKRICPTMENQTNERRLVVIE